MATVETYTSLETTTCVSCGVAFAMPDYMLQKRRDEGGDFYCPNGHTLVYKTPEVTKLRASLQQAQRAAIAARDEADKERKARQRVERRARAGTCPFGCKRPFVNLGRHVATKHPDAQTQPPTGIPGKAVVGSQLAFLENQSDPRHGTTNGYNNLHCRCDRCKEANRVAHHDYMHGDPVRLERHAQRERARRK